MTDVAPQPENVNAFDRVVHATVDLRAQRNGRAIVHEQHVDRYPRRRQHGVEIDEQEVAPPPASATRPRTAPARRRLVPTTPSRRRRQSAVHGGRLRRGRELHRVDGGVSHRCLLVVGDGVPRLGRRVRRRRELHRVDRHLPGRHARVVGDVCRPSAGVCDVAENCTGSGGDCPADSFASSATVCRASAGVCDVAENCTGSARRVRPTASRRRRPCAAASARRLRRGRELHGLGGGVPGRRLRVVGDGVPRLGGRLRRGRELHGLGARRVRRTASHRRRRSAARSAGVCDVAENCTGVERGVSGRRASRRRRRCAARSAGVCDVAENCTGSSAACPADAFASSATVCRASAGVCDVAENCTGSSAACPADALRSRRRRRAAPRRASATWPRTAPARARVSGRRASQSSATVCRGSAGVCDVAENCTGSSAACPADAFASSATVCRGSAGVCDVAENCTGSSAAVRPTPSSRRRPCAAARPASATWPRTARARARLSGRRLPVVRDACAAARPASATWPRTARARARRARPTASRRRRRSAAPRPASATWPRTAPARRGVSGRRVASSATSAAARRRLRRRRELHGVSDDCPADGFVSSATVCRASAGVCDVAENCTGSSAACPADASRRGTVCRAVGGRLRRRRELHGRRATPARPTPSQSSRRSAARRRASATSPRTAPGRARLSGRRLPVVGDGVPRLGRRLRRGRELHRPAPPVRPTASRASRRSAAPSAGVCDVAENCTGSARLPGRRLRSRRATVCRASAGVCDVAENCTGSSAACPADALPVVARRSAAPRPASATWPRTAPARRGLSRRRLRASRPSAAHRPASATSPRTAPASATIVRPTPSSRRRRSVARRPASATWPRTARARGAPCPADAFKSTAVCRASAGVCDVAENCDGSGDACPADGFERRATVCRASAGICDVAENCTGSAAPVRPTPSSRRTTVCRASAGVCDVAENCTGSARPVRPTRKRPRRSAAPVGRRLRRRRELRRHDDDCPADGFESSATVCRAVGGVCDVVENCTGSGAACPADASRRRPTVCRSVAGICDVAENCDGTGVDCPARRLRAGGDRLPPVAGVCDVAENCTGCRPELSGRLVRVERGGLPRRHRRLRHRPRTARAAGGLPGRRGGAADHGLSSGRQHRRRAESCDGTNKAVRPSLPAGRARRATTATSARRSIDGRRRAARASAAIRSIATT